MTYVHAIRKDLGRAVLEAARLPVRSASAGQSGNVAANPPVIRRRTSVTGSSGHNQTSEQRK